ncbi:PQQ-dependent sugar dehydrogenase [Flavobacterium sp. MFBS3-15]|uniref:PQQ-dependent sugar dehydrogenase n=1 Tax=Flavobacterium sp. MFBS3-15 TaxID=2989816 RepID=UPI002235B4C4|nr:PQQ-dependent sugar dehydrogenase [Flavobacterium sp. MFBS3-15]MCW4470250.1 PQQ-dependent sugar dehydrogenase [Flavobacterium sp. MFBS3-15]
MKSYLLLPGLTLAALTSICCIKHNKPYTAVDKEKGSVSVNEGPKENYAAYCAGCHGEKMNAFVDRNWKHGSSLDDLVKGIKNGWPDDGMPAFAQTFSDKEIEELAQYILTGIKERKEYDFDDRPKSDIFKSEKLTVRLEPVVTGIHIPWGMAFLPDGGILVTERGGKMYKAFNKQKQEIKGVPPVVAEGQGGLLDVAIHPDFAKNQWVYFSYSKPHPDNKRLATTAVMRAKLGRGGLSEQQIVFEAQPYQSTRHHYGSRLVFDGKGHLFISVGERGNERENPQTTDNNQLGKIHRINDDGTIPADNPIKDKSGKATSLYTYGNRNPQGLALHPVTGELWENEHGPRGGDEINILEPGKNYGWPLTSYGINYNGTTITDKTTAPGITDPQHYWIPSIGPSGLTFVTGDKYKPWKGAVLSGSLRFQYLNLSYLDGTKITGEEKLLKNIGRVRDVRMAPDGFIYVAVEEPAAAIYKLVPVQ